MPLKCHHCRRLFPYKHTQMESKLMYCKIIATGKEPLPLYFCKSSEEVEECIDNLFRYFQQLDCLERYKKLEEYVKLFPFRFCGCEIRHSEVEQAKRRKAQFFQARRRYRASNIVLDESDYPLELQMDEALLMAYRDERGGDDDESSNSESS